MLPLESSNEPASRGAAATRAARLSYAARRDLDLDSRAFGCLRAHSASRRNAFLSAASAAACASSRAARACMRNIRSMVSIAAEKKGGGGWGVLKSLVPPAQKSRAILNNINATLPHTRIYSRFHRTLRSSRLQEAVEIGSVPIEHTTGELQNIIAYVRQEGTVVCHH
eukprot:scaffold40418_cov29-Tisochrysis_lutea.AAC.2